MRLQWEKKIQYQHVINMVPWGEYNTYTQVKRRKRSSGTASGPTISPLANGETAAPSDRCVCPVKPCMAASCSWQPEGLPAQAVISGRVKMEGATAEMQKATEWNGKTGDALFYFQREEQKKRKHFVQLWNGFLSSDYVVDNVPLIVITFSHLCCW